MRSGEGQKSLAALITVLAATCVCLSPLILYAAGKAKPEIPLGEENYDLSSETKKNSSTPPQANEHAQGGSANKETNHTHPTPEASKKVTETSSKSVATPEQSDSPVKGSAASDANDVSKETSIPEKQASLLEGKVPPATPAKGSGFVWFGVIFVILAIAIFIFT